MGVVGTDQALKTHLPLARSHSFHTFFVMPTLWTVTMYQPHGLGVCEVQLGCGEDLPVAAR